MATNITQQDVNNIASDIAYGKLTNTTDINNALTPSSKSSFVMTDGWYVGIACLSGLLLANTRGGPLVFGVLTIALLYQITLLLQGK